MAWARVDDGFWCHPKVVTLDLDARGLWVSVLSWSCQQQTDRVPAQIVMMCGDDGTAAAKLVDAGLWREDGSGYVIHDWDDYQSERAKKAAAGRLGGKKSGETRRNEAEERASREADEGASDEADTAGSGEAGPTRPDPTRERTLAARPPLFVDVEGFPEPFPVTGSGLGKTLTAWAEASGFERPADRRPLPQFRWLLSVVDDVLGSGQHSHGCRMALIGEWCELAGSKPPESEAWGHIAALVKSYGGLPTLEAMHEATTNGAGLDEQWRDDPRSLTKYATKVLKNREAA